VQPETLKTGFVIAMLFALAAQFGVLANGLVWDDVTLIARDVRIRELSFALRSVGDSFWGPEHAGEMYRPVVNASFAVDWFLSGSAPGDVNVVWFHITNLVLHALNAGLAYVFLAEMTGRKLAAPLLAAVLFAVHPLAVEPVSWIAGRCDLLAAFFGFSAGILLLRTVKQKVLLWPALVLFGLSLFAKASFAFLPVIVALSVMAYRDVPLSRVLGKRLFPRFAAFALPAVVWIAARTAVLGAPFPVNVGVRWKEPVGFFDALFGVGRAFFVDLGVVFLPTRLCGDYLGDPAFSPLGNPPGLSAGIGLGLLVGALVLGSAFLKRARWAFPILAFVVALIPVLQVVRIGSIVADRFLYFPALFLFLLIGEGLEYAHRRLGGVRAFGVAFVLFLLLTVQSHVRAPAFADDVAFNRNVLLSYPKARQARQRLAVALSNTGDAEDRAEARRLLLGAIKALRKGRPSEELKTLAAIEIEDGDLDAAEEHLARALTVAGSDRMRADLHYNLAVVARRRHDPDGARRELADVLRLVPSHTYAKDMLRRLGE
jgi:hypothetical protein